MVWGIKWLIDLCFMLFSGFLSVYELHVSKGHILEGVIKGAYKTDIAEYFE